MNKEEYSIFLKLNLLDHHNQNILGTDNFSEPLENLNTSIKKLLDESIKIILENEEAIPKKLIEVIDSNINRINTYLTTIGTLANSWRNTSNTDQRQALINQREKVIREINDYVHVVYYQRPDEDRDAKNLLAVISLIKTYDNRSQVVINEYELKNKVVDEKIVILDDKITEFEKLLEGIRTEGAKKLIENYANIFLEEAERHSNYNSKLKFQKKFGSAEKWLIIGTISVIVLIVFVIYNNLFPIISYDFNDIPNLVTKLSLLGIIIFSIRFAIKQYSINKHLFTLNKHRANVLNSYQLFLQTVNDDGNIRNVLMHEVAKAIYEQGKTGFITEKDGDSSSPSIIEFTKLLTKDKVQ